MISVVVDFESYYDKEMSVDTVGLLNYVEQTDAYLISAVCDEFEFVGSPADFPKSMGGDAWMNDPRFQFFAANSNFDQKLWEKHYPKTARPWKCLLDRAAFHQLPRSLAGVIHSVFHRKLDKAVRDRMKGVRFESLPDSEQQEVADYCLNDGREEFALLKALPSASPIEEELAEHTRMCNRRGVHIDVEKVERDLGYMERVRWDAHNLIPWVHEDRAPLSYPAFCDWCGTQGLKPPASLDKRDLRTTQWMKENPVGARTVEAMRIFRGSNTKKEKLKTLLACVHNGVLPLELLYCGARHTRRWSSQGFNVQNLDKAPSFGEIMKEWGEPDKNRYMPMTPGAAGIFMREYLIPPPGCVFGILDFSQIEPRCLNWLVGNKPMLDAMRAGFGIYEAHAKATMGWKGAAGTMKKEFPQLYKFAKERVLSLGYGMGAGLFYDRARGLGLDITPEGSEAAVADFRATNKLITDFWKKGDQLIRSAAMDRSRHLQIEMPTGDLLQHFQVRCKTGGRGFESYTIKGDFSDMSKQPRLWGGTLTENITQRMARDVMAEAILRLEKDGFPVIFHAHDEVILALPINGAEEALEEASRLMSIAPDWCEGLPIGVDGDISPHYTKLV